MSSHFIGGNLTGCSMQLYPQSTCLGVIRKPEEGHIISHPLSYILCGTGFGALAMPMGISV